MLVWTLPSPACRQRTIATRSTSRSRSRARRSSTRRWMLLAGWLCCVIGFGVLLRAGRQAGRVANWRRRCAWNHGAPHVTQHYPLPRFPLLPQNLETYKQAREAYLKKVRAALQGLGEVRVWGGQQAGKVEWVEGAKLARCKLPPVGDVGVWGSGRQAGRRGSRQEG